MSGHDKQGQTIHDCEAARHAGVYAHHGVLVVQNILL
jgi:hypothetical protein